MSDAHDDKTPVKAEGPGTGNVPAIADPGLPPHQWRPTDVDERLAKRAERQVAGMFMLSSVFVLLFLVSYFALKVGDNHTTFAGFGASNIALGFTLGMALLLIGVGIIQWARKLMGDHEIVEMRHPARSSDEDREGTLEALNLGLEESGIGRRPLVRNSLLGAVGLLGLPAVVMLRDLGPLPGDKLYSTVWKPRMRVVRDVVGTPINVADIEIGDLVNAEPEIIFAVDEEGEHILEGVELQVAKSKAAVILLRMDPSDMTVAEGRENWSVDGIVCYSKICTHVGCPISLNERKTHHLLCPCHQSTFDLADSGKVVFGPAARSLPQLPLMVDEEGFLMAQRDFTEPVGPSFWERG
ncbi:Rieske 2Fe-2S domain-containing protein [Nocardioides sp.]|uniref:cytochrome bc1 complex Rieske iron-sulfur subunit n=1 Tax=Nocardioides sp. TaxID=35761 RepID=UPI00286A218E|nr:Rieske 2Fe-2S domain-containing protein [Nocardioides sp.]